MTKLSAVPTSAVHVWHGSIDPAGDPGLGPVLADWANLSNEERARCVSCRTPADQRRFAAVHAISRRILAAYLDTAASEIMFGRVPCCQCGDTRHGPPRIEWPRTDITFSLSHAESHWMLAVTSGRPVGVDIEVPAGADTGLLVRTSLSFTERAYVLARRREQREDMFYRCWTRKEAVLKACGVGLGVPPASVEVTPMRAPRARVHLACAAGPYEWLVEDLNLAPNKDGLPGPEGPSRAFGAIAQPLIGSGRVVLRQAGQVPTLADLRFINHSHSTPDGPYVRRSSPQLGGSLVQG